MSTKHTSVDGQEEKITIRTTRTSSEPQSLTLGLNDSLRDSIQNFVEEKTSLVPQSPSTFVESESMVKLIIFEKKTEKEQSLLNSVSVSEEEDLKEAKKHIETILDQKKEKIPELNISSQAFSLMNNIKKLKMGNQAYVQDMEEELLKQMISYAEEYHKFNNWDFIKLNTEDEVRDLACAAHALGMDSLTDHCCKKLNIQLKISSENKYSENQKMLRMSIFITLVDEIYSQKEIEVERILSKFSHVKQKFSSDLGHIYQKYISRTLSVNILVVGKTGIGKSTTVNTIINSSVSKSQSKESKTSDDVPCTDSFETKIYNIQNEDMYCPINVIDAPGLERMNEKKYADDLKNFITHRFDDPIHFIWHFVDKKGVDINIAQIQKELQLKYLLVISKSDILTKKQYSTLSKKLKNSSQDENQTGTVLISSKPETAPSMCPQCYETSIKSDKEKWTCGKCQYSKKIKEPWGIEELIKQSVNSEELVIETLLGSWRLLVMERIKSKISSSVDIISKYVQDNQLYISQQVALMTVDLSELWLYDSNEAQKNRSIISLQRGKLFGSSPELVDFFMFMYHGMLGGKTYATLKYGIIFTLTCALCYLFVAKESLKEFGNRSNKLNLDLENKQQFTLTEHIWKIYEGIKKDIHQLRNLKKKDSLKMSQELENILIDVLTVQIEKYEFPIKVVE